MITVYSVKGGKINNTTSLATAKKNKTPHIIDCINPTKQELADLKKRFNIENEDIRLALDKDSRPRVLDYETYSMVIFNSAYIKKKLIKTSSFGIFIFANIMLILRADKENPFKTFLDLPDERKAKEISKGPGYMAFLIMDLACDNFFRIMDYIEEEVNKLEEKVFKEADENTVRKIFKTKNSLIYLHRALTANREVIGSIEKAYLKMIPKKDITRFRYVYNDITELIDMETTYKDILTGAVEIYMSSVSNKLNDIMKKMTAMASFILIPTLISGIYGMNFRHMPELAWPYGYGFALALMVISVVIMYSYFKEKKWI